LLKQLRRGARLLQIGDLVIKHGLGSLLDLVGFSPGVFRKPRAESPSVRALPVAHRVRLLLEDLGPTFIKLGQIASTRSDVFGEDFVAELRELQDRIEPIPYSDVAYVIGTELGAPIDQLFAFFDPIPIGSASIGQVHRARLRDGREVVVKVQRPDVEELIRNDIAILGWAARRVESRLELARKMNVTGLLEEFEAILLDELLYTIEGHSADRMRQNLASNPTIKIPEVFWELTTQRVLTLEDVSGIKLTDRGGLVEANVNLPDLAVGLSRAYAKQILVDGFFHGDPHQGNLFVGPDGRIALVDFGIMGRLDEKKRDTLVSMFLAVLRQDSEEAVSDLVSLGAVSEDTDMVALVRDVDRLLSRYYFLPRHEIHIGEIMDRVLEVVHRHDVRMPTDLALLAKVLLTIEGICIQLDPTFDANAAVRPFARELMERSLSPNRLATELGRTAREISRVVRIVPTQLIDLLGKAERGRLKLVVQYDQSDRSLDHLYEIGNRLAASISLAAMLVGSGVILHTHLPPLLYGYPALGWFGCVVSMAMLCRLLITLFWGTPGHRRAPLRRPR
jgi:ubiquinone biosynthesis protein